MTDYDAGVEGEAGIEPVNMETVLRVLAENVEAVQRVLLRAVPEIPADRACSCHQALDPGSLPP